jgi:hypothetical protein
MTWLDRLMGRRNEEWFRKWEAEHRWDRLADYNAERGRGILHTPEWDALMRDEQLAFNQAHGFPDDLSALPYWLDPSPR